MRRACRFPKPPQSFRDRRALQKHNGENSYGVALRGELGWGTIITAYQSLYKMWGATDFEVEGDKLVSKVNSPEAVEMTDWYVKLIQEGGSPTWASATWSSCGGELGAGTAAIMLDATNNRVFPDNPRKCGRSREFGNCSHSSAGRQDRCRYKITALDLVPGNEQRICHKDAAWLFLQYFQAKNIRMNLL